MAVNLRTGNKMTPAGAQMPLRRAFAGEESLRWALAKGQKLQVRLWLATADAPAQVDLLRSGGPAAPRRASRTQAGLPHSGPPCSHGKRDSFMGCARGEPFLIGLSFSIPLCFSRCRYT